MKKILVAVLVVVFAISLLGLVACQPDETKTIPETKVGMYFTVNGYADTVYSISENRMSSAELTMITSLQGVLAQTEATIYIEGSEGQTAERLQSLSERYGFEIEQINNAWSLVDMFADAFDGKYVLYNDHSTSGVSYNDQTINYATTICGAEGYIMIAKNMELTAQKHGLTCAVDATVADMNTRTVFETYKDMLSTKVLVHQNPEMRYLRDYAIAAKAMCFYSDYYDGDSSVKTDILAWADVNAPILGWTENEVNFVAANSMQSIVTVAADYAVNLSTYSAGCYEKIEQNNHVASQATTQGKHHVAIVMSDGDNVQWMTRGFATSTRYYGSTYRGNFPITWTTSPSLYDLAPNVLADLYGTATANDLFIAGPSGVGYVNATGYNPDSLADYAAYTAGYMEKTDMQYINLLDNYVDEEILDVFSQYSQIKGGVWSVGNKYIEGEGAVYWSNDKPFVCARETLWRIAGDDNSNKYYGFVERVAQRINEYSTDCTQIEGYTIVLAHVWSIGSMDYINRFVEQLDENVEVVSLDTLLDLISKNVKHENAFPNDIAPSDLDNILQPISSEQYDWNIVKSTPVSSERTFEFTSEKIASLWGKGDGGLQYDKAVWVAKDSRGKPAIMLDGSDLEDVVDPLPNSWIYNMFALSANADADNYLYLTVVGGVNADVNLRIRAIYEENGKAVSVILNSENYEANSVNNYGWYKHTSSSIDEFVYNLSQVKGKKVLISIEQDDTGDGSGEIVYVEKVQITDQKIVHVSAFPNWGIADIRYDWISSGAVEYHSEGICLEAKTAPASLSYTFTVTEDTKFVKFYVRMFVRNDSPDAPPKLQLQVNGKVVKAINAPNDYVVVTGDNYRCIGYDLTEFVGQEITLTIISLEGDHAAIGRITVADSCTLSEISKLYNDSELKSM